MRTWIVLMFFLPQSSTYWVSPAGDDANPGTPAQPWKTPAKAASTAGAGDTVYFANGTYSVNGTVAIPAGAVFQAQIVGGAVLQGSGANPRVDLGIGATLRGFHLVGLRSTWTGQDTPGSVNCSDDVLLEDLEIEDGEVGARADGANGVTMRRVRVHHCGDQAQSGRQAAGGGFWLVGTTNSLLEDCESHHNEDGIADEMSRADGFSFWAVSNVTLRRCYAHDNREDGFDLDGGPSLFENCRSMRNAHKGFKVWQAGHTFRNCVAWDNQTGINLIAGPGTNTIVNCTFALNGFNPYPGSTRPAGFEIEYHGGGLSLRNCVIWHRGDKQAFWIDTALSNLAEESNLYFKDPSSTSLRVIQTQDGTQYFPSDFPGNWPGSYGDPLFVNASSANLRLTPGSPAIDSASATGAPSFDVEGNVRPAGAGFDRGAYEYGSSGGGGGGGTGGGGSPGGDGSSGDGGGGDGCGLLGIELLLLMLVSAHGLRALDRAARGGDSGACEIGRR